MLFIDVFRVDCKPEALNLSSTLDEGWTILSGLPALLGQPVVDAFGQTRLHIAGSWFWGGFRGIGVYRGLEFRVMF